MPRLCRSGNDLGGNVPRLVRYSWLATRPSISPLFECTPWNLINRNFGQWVQFGELIWSWRSHLWETWIGSKRFSEIASLYICYHYIIVNHPASIIIRGYWIAARLSGSNYEKAADRLLPNSIRPAPVFDFSSHTDVWDHAHTVVFSGTVLSFCIFDRQHRVAGIRC